MTTEKKKLLKYAIINTNVKVCITIEVTDDDGPIKLIQVSPILGVCPNYTNFYGRKFRNLGELREVLISSPIIPHTYKLADLVINPVALMRELGQLSLELDLHDEDLSIEVIDNRLYLHNPEQGYVLRFLDGEWGSNTYSGDLISTPRA